MADFASKLKPGVLKIDKFVVTGASKVCDVCVCTLIACICMAGRWQGVRHGVCMHCILTYI